MTATAQEIKTFWEDRARVFGEDARATLREMGLRRLEIRTMMKQIRHRKPARVLDVGCGNGHSTRRFAVAFPRHKFVGVDFSTEMICQASKRTSAPNCSFVVGDVTDPESLPTGCFDLVITQRCLQNLPNYELQKHAVRILLSKCNKGGTLLLMECSRDGVERLNTLRRRFGREPIEGIEAWHNTFFCDRDLTEDFGARIFHFSSTYMFLTRMIHPRLARLGLWMPPIGRFGYDKIYVIERA